MSNEKDSTEKEKTAELIKRLIQEQLENENLLEKLALVNQTMDEEFAIPERLKKCTLENFQPQGAADSETFISQATAMMECKSFVREYPCTSIGLLLVGNCGVGKTHLAVGVLKAIEQKTKNKVAFVDCGSLLRKVRDSYKTPNCWESKILSPIYKAEIVLLDNLGLVHPSAWAIETLTIVINTIYNQGSILLATTNFFDNPTSDTPALVESVGIRVRSRLYQMCKYVSIRGDDYRKKLSSSKSYY